MKLFEPGQIGKLRLKNRIMMSAMGCGSLTQLDGSLSQRGIDYFVARAKGGVAMVSTGSARVTREFERIPTSPISPGLMLDNKLYARWVYDLSDAVHDHGCKLNVQLAPGLGRCLSKPDLDKGIRPIGPSALPCLADPKALTCPLTVAEIARMMDAFEAAGEVLKAGGADSVELNCHAGYLADQFMTSLWNQREDDYGGNLENRVRFVAEMVQRLKRSLGPKIPVIVKYALTHYLPGGREPAEGVEIARLLELAGVDALTVDAGCRETFYWTMPSEFLPDGCTLDLAEQVRRTVKIPVIAVGKMGNPELSEQALQNGRADFIALGRTLLADPDWANKVKAQRPRDVIPCVDCYEGCHKFIHEGKPISCAVNPATGNERNFAIVPAQHKKKVLVIGGGPGGMEAARVAAVRGHDVRLWEKDEALGGNLKPGSGPEFKEIYRRLVDYLGHQLEHGGVEVSYGYEATPERVNALAPDVVVVATGSTPVVPSIVGMERTDVVIANDVLVRKKTVGDTVVIVGGGVVGCETALYLAREGRKVTVIELQKALGGDMYYINRQHMFKLLKEAGVEMLAESRVLEIEATGLVYENRDGLRQKLLAETIVLAVGFRSQNALIDQLQDQVPEVFAIGDCLAPRKVMEAMQEAYRVARRL